MIGGDRVVICILSIYIILVLAILTQITNIGTWAPSIPSPPFRRRRAKPFLHSAAVPTVVAISVKTDELSYCISIVAFFYILRAWQALFILLLPILPMIYMFFIRHGFPLFHITIHDTRTCDFFI